MTLRDELEMCLPEDDGRAPLPRRDRPIDADPVDLPDVEEPAPAPKGKARVQRRSLADELLVVLADGQWRTTPWIQERVVGDETKVRANLLKHHQARRLDAKAARGRIPAQWRRAW